VRVGDGPAVAHGGCPGNPMANIEALIGRAEYALLLPAIVARER
jgi:hypothetical protein